MIQVCNGDFCSYSLIKYLEEKTGQLDKNNIESAAKGITLVEPPL